MKKFSPIYIFLAIITVLASLTACSGGNATLPPAPTSTNIAKEQEANATATFRAAFNKIADTQSATLGFTPTPRAAAPQEATTTPKPANVVTVPPTTLAPKLIATVVTQTTPAKVKETVTVGGYTVTLNNVERSKQLGQFSKAKDGNIFIALELTFISTQSKNVNVNSFNGRLIDSNAFSYNSSTGKTPYLPSQNDLPAGELTRGWWTYEVPENVKGLILDYKSGFPEIRFRFNIEEEGNPTTQTVKVDPPKLAKKGETITSEGYLVTVNTIEKAKNFGQYTKAEDGFVLIAVDITVESDKDKGVSVHPFNTAIRDADGYFYTYTVGKEPPLNSQNDLPKGEKMRGWVTFSVPEKATGLYLEYKTGFPQAKARFNLE